MADPRSTEYRIAPLAGPVPAWYSTLRNVADDEGTPKDVRVAAVEALTAYGALRRDRRELYTEMARRDLEARAELDRRDTTIAAVRALCEDLQVESVTGGMTDAGSMWPSEVLELLPAPVEAGATEPARDGDSDEVECARCAHRVVPGCPDCDPVPYDTSVTCGDCAGPNGVGGACVLPPDHPHVDGIGGVWPATGAAEPDADELLLVRMPGRMSGRATIGHSRLPLTTILGYLRAGDSIDLVTNAYPSLTAEQARVADALRMELDAPDDDEADEAGAPAEPTSDTEECGECGHPHADHPGDQACRAVLRPLWAPDDECWCGRYVAEPTSDTEP